MFPRIYQLFKKHTQKITPGLEKMPTLKKLVRIFLKKSRIIIPEKFKEKSLNFMKFGVATEKL